MNPEDEPYNTQADIPAEDKILRELVQPGMSALDVGCGVGRSTLKLRALTDNVWSIDRNVKAIRRLRRRSSTNALVADMRNLPFPDGHFDLVLVALCGIDYLLTRSDRATALREMERVLRAGGFCVLSSHNRLGVFLSPRGLTNIRWSKWRLRHVFSGRVFRRSFVDLNGIQLYQSLPPTLIREVTSATQMKFVFATNRFATTRSLLLLSMFSAIPHFVFAKETT